MIRSSGIYQAEDSSFMTLNPVVLFFLSVSSLEYELVDSLTNQTSWENSTHKALCIPRVEATGNSPLPTLPLQDKLVGKSAFRENIKTVNNNSICCGFILYKMLNEVPTLSII